MTNDAFVVASSDWLLRADSHPKRLTRQALCPLGVLPSRLGVGCNVLVKFRDRDGKLRTDDQAKIELLKATPFIKSKALSQHVQERLGTNDFAVFYFEGTREEARCIVDIWDEEVFATLAVDDPTLRMATFDLPPRKVTIVNSSRLRNALYRNASSLDRELYAVHSATFLEAPHILTPLFAHVLSLRSEDNINFPIVVKKIAEQLRALLLESKSSVCIERMSRDHSTFWKSVNGEPFAFLDGGVARIPGLANLEPLAMRVGVYCVSPGDRDLSTRERWELTPYVLADIVEPGGITPLTDRKRIQEAARYVLEPLTGLSYLREHPDVAALVLHGPLVNQFLMYDEGEPNHIGRLAESFLSAHEVDRSRILKEIKDIPSDGRGEMWNQFTAVYALVLRLLANHGKPIVGVVERALGRPVTTSLLMRLREERVVTRAYVDRIEKELDRYDITDDFLFGCMLRDGEYLTPLVIQKNPSRRARPRWQPVVAQFTQPNATLLKAEEVKFPFRIEMNARASERAGAIIGLIYHTARLLPRYSFPVGLDIADKYAKVPDWIARGISGEVSASVLKRALDTGDPQLVAQVKQLLARGSKGFFFRPNS